VVESTHLGSNPRFDMVVALLRLIILSVGSSVPVNYEAPIVTS
jgi:hypothetical protein